MKFEPKYYKRYLLAIVPRQKSIQHGKPLRCKHCTRAFSYFSVAE